MLSGDTGKHDPGLIIGVGGTVVLVGSWVVALIVQRRLSARSSSRELSTHDREAVMHSRALHDTATAGQMVSMASAQRQ